MDAPHWKYETCTGNRTCVSVRASATVEYSIYEKYLAEFAAHHSDRLLYIGDILELYDGGLCTMVYLSGLSDIDYPLKFIF